VQLPEPAWKYYNKLFVKSQTYKDHKKDRQIIHLQQNH